MAASNTGFTQNRLGQSKNPIDSDHGIYRYNFPAENFYIWPRALPRCRPSHVWLAHKLIRRGPCASLSCFRPAA